MRRKILANHGTLAEGPINWSEKVTPRRFRSIIFSGAAKTALGAVLAGTRYSTWFFLYVLIKQVCRWSCCRKSAAFTVDG